MKLSDTQLKTALGTLQIARQNWTLDEFVSYMFEKVYEAESESHQKYLKEKFDAFFVDPLKFYFYLDLAMQAHLNKYLKTLVARVAI